MNRTRSRLRHLPPSAVPIAPADMRAGLSAPASANDDFRAAIADYFGLAPQACRLASSGRTGLYILLQGLATERPTRRQVVMPAYTCPVLPRVTLDLGLEPVYVDLWPESTRFIQEQLAAATGEQTLGIILVHPFGIPLAADDVLELAQRSGAVVIEDAAQAMGASWAGRRAGLAGDYALFSLGPGKPLSTGAGGVIITNREENVESLARWWADLPPATGLNSAQAWMRQLSFRLAFHPRVWWTATRLGLHRLGNHEESWGYTLRDLSRAQAGIGLALLPRLDEINALRRKLALRLAAAVDNARSVRLLEIEADAEPFFLRLPLLAESENARELLQQKMWAAGIGAGRMYEKTLPEIFGPLNRASFPGAESFAHRLLTLPTHFYVSEDDLRVMEAILTVS